MRPAIITTLVAVVAAHIVVVFAGFFAPYAPNRQHRHVPLTPPVELRFFDSEARFRMPPVFQSPNTGRDVPLQFLVQGDSYQIAGLWSSRLHLFGVREPDLVFLLGSDEFGRDQFSRFVWGAQLSLFSGLAAALLALALGACLGAVAGMFGKRADDVLMSMAELFLALPWFYLLLGVRATLPLDLHPGRAFLVIVCLLGAIGWAKPARLVRGIVLSAREREYVLAARGFGASDWYLLRKHVLPEARGVLAAQAALLIPQYILAEITMSFLGLGVNEPGVSWGLMLRPLQQYSALVGHWWLWIPAALVVPFVFGYHLLARAVEGQDSSYSYK